MEYMHIYRFSFFCLSLWAGAYAHQPLVSIITSVYKGDHYIAQFMKDITQQTIFEKCELIMINANSPDHEDKIIRKYMNRYPNIRYLKLDHDPGLYAVWNLGIKMARAEFITNANLDDRLKIDCYQAHLNALIKNPHIDLVYSDYYITNKPNETFKKNSKIKRITVAEFSPSTLTKSCLPNNHPLWRKSMHGKYGLFDETYKSAGDWEMWLRAVEGGAKFLKVDGVYGLFYINPQGLSTCQYNYYARTEPERFLKKYRDLKNLKSQK